MDNVCSVCGKVLTFMDSQFRETVKGESRATPPLCMMCQWRKLGVVMESPKGR